jgi:hypothetical protein
MINEQNELHASPSGGDIVDLAIADLHDHRIPALSADLCTRTAALARDAAACQAVQPHPQERPRRGLRRSVTALATAAAIAAAAVGMVDVWPTITGTRSATAQVVETIRRAVAVRFTKQMAGSRVRVLEDGGVVREEHPDGTVMIMDYTQRRLLQLDPVTKEAIQGTMSGSDLPEGQSVLALFRDRITAADGAFVGRVSLGDMEAHEYRFSLDDSDAAVTVWVTPESSLPLKAMVQGPEWLPVRETIFAEFDWNPTFEAGQMTLDVPSGYTIDTLQTIDRAMTTFAEQRRACTAALACGTCLTEFLAIYADCFQGRFPDGLDAESVKIKGWELMRLRPEDIQRHGEQALPRRVEDVSQKWERLLSLTSSLQSLGREMHYLGKGRSRGDGKGPLAWWQTFDGTTCIVVADDLSISEVAGAALARLSPADRHESGARSTAESGP